MFVIGTAGHVDHGKSTLVKALTGIDPDRWEEERRREMTIDLGFAWLTLPSERVVSIVDVPGHERFIKNMLAGIGGIDAALLVIAADESVMPQTEEHLAILDLLGVAHGLVALSKVDLVDGEWLELVREEVAERLRGTSLDLAPIVPASARSGQGLPELLAALDAVLDGTPSRSAAHGAPRLSIDRAFTIGGFGAVVTGTLADGPLRVGDEVEILPTGLRARVRGLQSHSRRQEVALPGTRVAVNLAGVSHHEIARGDVLALPDRMRPTQIVDVRVRLVPDLRRPLVQNTPLDLFVGAAETRCHVTLLDRDQLSPGESGWLQLRLAAPIVAARGDRYILRQPSPGRTVGGGAIVDPHPARHRRFRTEVIAALESLARGTPADLLRQALAGGLPRPWRELQRASGLGEDLALEGIEVLIEAGEVIPLAEEVMGQEVDGIPDVRPERPARALPPGHLITSAGWATLRAKLTGALDGYHRRYPLRAGMPREELRSRLKLSGPALDAVLARAAIEGLVLVREGDARHAGHVPSPTPEQRRDVERLLDAMRASPYSPPAPELDPELLAWLVERGEIVRVAEDVAFQAPTYEEMVGWVVGRIGTEGSVTVAQFRDRFGTSRKYALALLEHLDARRVTRREGDARVLY